MQKRLQSTSVSGFWPASPVGDWLGQSIPSDDCGKKKTRWFAPTKGWRSKSRLPNPLTLGNSHYQPSWKNQHIWIRLSYETSERTAETIWDLRVRQCFYKLKQPLHSPDMKPANVPSPPLPIFWLIKYLIHGVRNFEFIILKRLLLYQLASRQHFYFGEY